MANKIITINGYIVATATVPGGHDADADSIEQMLQHQPDAQNGFVYQLRESDLEWVLVELPPEPEPEATAYDYEEALGRFGV